MKTLWGPDPVGCSGRSSATFVLECLGGRMRRPAGYGWADASSPWRGVSPGARPKRSCPSLPMHARQVAVGCRRPVGPAGQLFPHAPLAVTLPRASAWRRCCRAVCRPSALPASVDVRGLWCWWCGRPFRRSHIKRNRNSYRSPGASSRSRASAWVPRRVACYS